MTYIWAYFIDLSMIDNRLLSTNNWDSYSKNVVISSDLRIRIEEILHTYEVGMISKKEKDDMVFDAINLNYKDSLN